MPVRFTGQSPVGSQPAPLGVPTGVRGRAVQRPVLSLWARRPASRSCLCLSAAGWPRGSKCLCLRACLPASEMRGLTAITPTSEGCGGAEGVSTSERFPKSRAWGQCCVCSPWPSRGPWARGRGKGSEVVFVYVNNKIPSESPVLRVIKYSCQQYY